MSCRAVLTSGAVCKQGGYKQVLSSLGSIWFAGYLQTPSIFPIFLPDARVPNFLLRLRETTRKNWGKLDLVTYDHLPKNCAFSPTFSYFSPITKFFFLPFPRAFPFSRISPHPPHFFLFSPIFPIFQWLSWDLGTSGFGYYLGLNYVHVACWVELLLVAACGTGSRRVYGMVSQPMSSLLASTKLAYSLPRHAYLYPPCWHIAST